MLKHVVLRIMLIMLLVNVLMLAFNIKPIKAQPKTIIVPENYPSIQEAINNADEGDTIYVKTGTYYENLVINKSISLIGDSARYTMIDANSAEDVIWINQSEVNITSLRMINGSYGVRLSSSTKCNIQDCYIDGNSNSGIFLFNSSNCFVTNCRIAVNMYEGIHLERSSHNTIINCSILSSGVSGIWICNSSTSNTILDCDIHSIIYGGYGIVIHSNSSSNTIKSCDIYSNDGDGVWIYDSSDNLVMNCYLANNHNGICLSGSDNLVANSSIQRNEYYGIFIGSNNNTVTDCCISDNEYGICGSVGLVDSNFNTIKRNTIQNNHYGVHFTVSNFNFVYHNNLINNTAQASVENYFHTNMWNNGYPFGGNYWNDYNGTDSDGDGIGDSPYKIDSNNQDDYPLMDLYIPSEDMPVLQELMAKYNKLSSICIGLITTCQDLIHKHNSLNASYGYLQTAYSYLNTSFHSVQEDYNDLQLEYNALVSEQNFTRNLMYIFITTTIIFTTITLYLAKKRKSNGTDE